jgi:hypothetical protein
LAPAPGRIRRRLGHVPAGLVGCGVVLVGAVAVGALTRGATGALGAAVGVIGVAVSYLVSGLAVAWADSINPRLVLPVGLAVYAAKFTLLGVVLVALSEWSWEGLRPMALAMLAAVIGWVAAHMWWVTHARIPYVEINPR